MIINYPITDYIKQSILTTKGDLVVEGVTDPERLASAALDLYLKSQGAGNTPIYEAMALLDTGIKIGLVTRSTGGTSYVSGLGFKPSTIILIAVDDTDTNKNWSVGFSDVDTDMCITMANNGSTVEELSTVSIHIRRDGSNILTCEVYTRTSDGFNINWTLTGAISLTFIYLALP